MNWAWLCRAANTGQHFAWRGLQHDELLDSTWLAIACLGRLSASWFLSLRCVHEKNSTFLIFQCPRFSNGSSAVIALARTWQSTKNEQDGTCRTVMAEIPFTEPWLSACRGEATPSPCIWIYYPAILGRGLKMYWNANSKGVVISPRGISKTNFIWGRSDALSIQKVSFFEKAANIKGEHSQRETCSFSNQ